MFSPGVLWKARKLPLVTIEGLELIKPFGSRPLPMRTTSVVRSVDNVNKLFEALPGVIGCRGLRRLNQGHVAKAVLIQLFRRPVCLVVGRRIVREII